MNGVPPSQYRKPTQDEVNQVLYFVAAVVKTYLLELCSVNEIGLCVKGKLNKLE